MSDAHDLEYWKADSAAAWDACEARRLECEALKAKLADLAPDAAYVAGYHAGIDAAVKRYDVLAGPDTWDFFYTAMQSMLGLKEFYPLAAKPQAAPVRVVGLIEAVEALGAMPDGYCFCSKNRIGDDSKVHEPECADIRAFLRNS